MNSLQLLLVSSAFLGFIHTLLGPDHYLPFIVLSKARRWSMPKTLWITFISGVGHVGGSVVLGVLGIVLGVSLSSLEAIESLRGNLVGWIIIAFGIVYTLYGIKKYLNNGGRFTFFHFLIPKKIRKLQHITHYDSINNKEDNTKLTPWVLFLIFVFGPCEVLIPMLIFPAAQFNVFGIVAVSLVFGIATISTMLLSVYLGYKGATLIKFKNDKKFFHIIAGVVIVFSGIGMQFMGW